MNAIKEVFEAGDERSSIVLKQRGCLVHIPGGVTTNSNTGVQGFWLWAFACRFSERCRMQDFENVTLNQFLNFLLMEHQLKILHMNL